MDIVEVQDLIVVLLVMVTVVPQHVVLVYVVHDMDIVELSAFTVLTEDQLTTLNQRQSKVSFEELPHTTMKAKSAHNTQPVVLNVANHWTKTIHKSLWLL